MARLWVAAAEELAPVMGCDPPTALVALAGVFEEYSRAAGLADTRELVRTRPIEEILHDVDVFRDALMKKALPPPPKKGWRQRLGLTR